MEIILEARDVSKTFMIGDNNEQTVLKSVNMQLVKGERLAVMGPSGSGKSTLLYNISGMDRVTAGNILFHNQEISSLSEKDLSDIRLNKMGFIFQDIYLLKNLSIFDNIVLSAYLTKNESREKINQRALELMKKMGIAELADHDITQASGGQLQRAAICRALINEPDIVFGDEPTGALNSKSAADIMRILAEVNESGTTIMLVTHDVKVAAKMDRVIYMLDGNIVGEKQLGKYNERNDDGQIREEILSNWLRKLDF